MSDFSKMMEAMEKLQNTSLNGEITTTTRIWMDTKHEKEGLHIWITESTDKDSSEFTSKGISIHLNREQCRFLRDEINRRLF